jgi:ketosteroid isomerase-like protein
MSCAHDDDIVLFSELPHCLILTDIRCLRAFHEHLAIVQSGHSENPMSRAWLLLIVSLIFCPPVAAQSSGVQANVDVIADADVKALEQRLCTLLVNRRYHEYALYLADDYVRTTSSGELQSKQEVLDGFAEQSDILLSMVPEDMKVRVYGDAAVLTLRLTTQVKSGDGVEARFSRATQTFVRRNGRWFLASMSAIPLAE